MTIHNLNPAPSSNDDALSALVDGELDDGEAKAALKAVLGNARDRDTYREYCLVGDALRGYHHDTPNLTDRVMSALEREPTLLAPMPARSPRRPALWLAAATVAAITWGLWSAVPREETLAPLAANQPPPAGEAGNIMPYLAAHQDFAQAVVAPSEMRITRVSLAGADQ
ncbi:MAG TPA: sigma-E factor negative regulatory protein [Thiobacillaceae bacterium]|nr:sigma-E factor negative regulatory protein [Thiobacillaceae bacterium]HNA83139.1 sigma-E factor negative regulatory protein [Thiobacillaceae bacterium]HNF87800.1 sigma-E factor negative regulatory protein [Thiobacillaceae bacterium]HNH89977.1 sigma-E factor negative regulatory protein [Thiobacillaceae bacterium]HNI07327.1 sigma-E factor negative regulatory protein [Thiobacillaceae bacterium]